MTPFRWWMTTVTAIALLLALSWCVKAAPIACEATSAAVLAKGAKHATWNWIAGRKCWHAGYPAAARIGPARLKTASAGLPHQRPASAPPPWHVYTQADVDAAWRRYEDARQRYDAAAMFLNLLMFGTLCPQNNGECNFGRRLGR